MQSIGTRLVASTQPYVLLGSFDVKLTFLTRLQRSQDGVDLRLCQRWILLLADGSMVDLLT